MPVNFSSDLDPALQPTPKPVGSAAPGDEGSDRPAQLPASPPAPPNRSDMWAVFASTFVTIFLAEMGDKTQIATLLMSAESHHPAIVFAGAATALVCTSLLGVLVGRWLSKKLSPVLVERCAGGILLLISLSLTWDVLH